MTNHPNRSTETVTYRRRYYGDSRYPKTLWTGSLARDLLNRARELSADADDVEPDSFAAACIKDNTISDLVEALGMSKADNGDCDTWGLTAVEWRAQIRAGLRAMVANVDDNAI